jgi:hypothetical protein
MDEFSFCVSDTVSVFQKAQTFRSIQGIKFSPDQDPLESNEFQFLFFLLHCKPAQRVPPKIW